MFAAFEESKVHYIIITRRCSKARLLRGPQLVYVRRISSASCWRCEDHLTPDGKLVVLLPRSSHVASELAAANGLGSFPQCPHRDR